VTFERRDPEDPDTPGEPSAADIDAAFAQIIAGWDNEGRSRWSDSSTGTDPVPGHRDQDPADPPGDARTGADLTDPPTEELPAARFDRPADAHRPADFPDFPGYPDDIDPADLDDAAHARTHGQPEPDDDYDDADDHFVPPEPPPVPRPQPATIGAAVLFLLGIVLLVAPWAIGFSSQYGLPLGLLAITGSLVWLGSRLRQGPPPDSGWDDGARL
jgi:hypothetical protein